jgi:HD-GYP domain-containing protein (c-di-GMP phosphodiesterase class II)
MQEPTNTKQTVSPAPAQAQSAPPLAQVMESLALRFRPCGLFVALLNRDGTVACHDAGAGLFFNRFVLPLLQYPQPLGESLRKQVLDLIAAASTCSSPTAPPGSRVESACFLDAMVVAAFPHYEKRQLAGVILLAGKAQNFRLSEEVLGVCSRLGIDGPWLEQQAIALPFTLEESLVRDARLLAGMVRDQLRLAGLEHELDSLSTHLSNSYEELTLIYQISGGMKINRGAGEFFKHACLDVIDVMGVRGMGVALCGESCRQEPVLYGEMSLPPGQTHRLANDLMSVLLDRKSPLLINDLAQDQSFEGRFTWVGAHAKQLLAVPLQRQDQVLGCLFSLDKTRGDFDSVDSKLLNSIANESAIYLENAMLFDDVRDLMMGLLHSLTSAVDAKDAYTCGHSERVALLARRLSQEAKYPAQRIERIYMSGLLHDVGKIGVPESVLQKTGRLTPEEFEQMKKHPQIGARILKDIKQMEDVIPGVLHHHERYDGKGYPYGLAGQNIPLMGRIICLADSFDAMTSNRTYRRALPLEVALTEIRRYSGTQFDPELAQVFLRISAEEFRALLSEHQRDAQHRPPDGEGMPPMSVEAA